MNEKGGSGNDGLGDQGCLDFKVSNPSLDLNPQ